MFFNENSVRFGGNIGTITKTETGCLRFGVCQSISTKVGDKWVDSTNWITVLFTQKQTELFVGQLKKGDEILLEGEIRMGKYNDNTTVTLFVKRVLGHVPSETRTLATIFRKSSNEAKAKLLDQDTLSGLIEGVPATTNKAQQSAPVAQPATPEQQPAQQTPLNLSQMSPEMVAVFQQLLQQATLTQPVTQQPTTPVQNAQAMPVGIIETNEESVNNWSESTDVKSRLTAYAGNNYLGGH